MITYGNRMHFSPAGRQIQAVEGNPDDIVERGEAITTLGAQMRSSAELLRTIDSRASEQQGQAIDKLKERIGSSCDTLFQAAALYEPVGPVVSAYGNALAFVKPRIDAHADECERLWVAFSSLPGEVEPRGTGGFLEPEAGSPEADAQAADDEAKRIAYAAWRAEAVEFDDDVDTWEQAFDDAVEGFTEGVAGAIEDSEWRSFLGFASQALGWAALIVGVAALIIGGPILAVLALAVGVLALAVTIAQAVEGDKNGWDVALAVVGILPVGKLSSLTKLSQGRYAAYADDVFAAFRFRSTPGSPPTDLLSIARQDGASEVFKRLLTGSTSRLNQARLNGYEAAGDAFGVSWQTVNNIDVVSSLAGNALRYEGWIAQATPYPGVGSVPVLGPALSVLT